MKIILDANVIIAAFASRGLCESILELCFNEHEIFLCNDLINEITRNLKVKIKLPLGIINSIKEFLKEHATILEPSSLPNNSCRDADDIKILGLAIAAKVDYIITGDKDLLILEYFQGIQILNPRAFSDLLHRKENR